MENITPRQTNIWFALKVIIAIYVIFSLSVWMWNAVRTHEVIGKAPTGEHTLMVSGDGKVTAAPNIATVTVGLVNEGTEVPAAQKENTEKMNNLIAELHKIGIPDKDTQTADYLINPKYEYKEGRTSISGYTVSQNVRVKIRDLTKTSAVLAAAGKIGANQVSGVNFAIDEPENLRAEARAKAVMNAREKAEAIARSLGIRLGRVVAFSESSGGFPPPMPYALERLGVGGGDYPQPKVESGSLDVVVSVSVTYEIK